MTLASLGTSFSDLSRSLLPLVEARLASAWDERAARLAKYGPDVRASIAAARDLTLRGGKRIRAALVAIGHGAAAPDAPLDVAVRAGSAFELFHAYLLLQDDWMDGDATRRGGPTAHVAIGKHVGDAHLGAALTILVSDLTWGIALEELLSLPTSMERRQAAIALFSRVHEDVVVGQMLDVMRRSEDVEAMHQLKTGSYTVRGPLALGAVLGGASDALKAGLDRYAAPLGIAFQLRDDLLGTFGDEATTGKPVGNDLRAGKRTAVLVEAERSMDAVGRAALERVVGVADADANAIEEATYALVQSGARARVEARLASLCEEAAVHASTLEAPTEARRLLTSVAAAVRGAS
jgi:geranylgeranyl diphosphate synthase type I